MANWWVCRIIREVYTKNNMACWLPMSLFPQKMNVMTVGEKIEDKEQFNKLFMNGINNSTLHAKLYSALQVG